MSSRKWGQAISARGEGFAFNSRKFITARIYREGKGEWTRDPLFVACALRRRIVIPFSGRNERATKDLTGNRAQTPGGASI